MKREDMLNAAGDSSIEWDIVIIGGGATGLACAHDASLRGYRTILIEQSDFAKGTSSRSTKLIHGGVRYLRQGNVGLVREALRERAHLLHNASGIVRPIPFVIPSQSFWEQIWYGTGLKVYDSLAGKRGLKRSAWLSRAQVAERVPGLSLSRVRGGTLYFDAQFDDTRLAMAMAQTAVLNGATLVNYVSAQGFAHDPAGKICAVQARDSLNGRAFTLRCKVAINATGVFSDAIREMDDHRQKAIISPAQGIHLVLPKRFLGGEVALLIPKTDDRRVLFAIPWHHHTLIGTTDTARPSAELEPVPLTSEIDYLLEHSGRYLNEKPTREDIQSVWAGLRPLIKPPDSTNTGTAEVSREHCIFGSPSGLLTIAGGKWTTCRTMAEDTINRATTIGKLPSRACQTIHHRLAEEPDGDSPSEKLHPDLPYTFVDISRAIEQEMAIKLEDVLARRTRCLFLNAAASLEIAPKIAHQMEARNRQGSRWIERELTEFRELAQNYLP